MLYEGSISSMSCSECGLQIQTAGLTPFQLHSSLLGEQPHKLLFSLTPRSWSWQNHRDTVNHFRGQYISKCISNYWTISCWIMSFNTPVVLRRSLEPLGWFLEMTFSDTRYEPLWHFIHWWAAPSINSASLFFNRIGCGSRCSTQRRKTTGSTCYWSRNKPSSIEFAKEERS